MKRIVTMQDLSCVGKCSLSIALPILSVMGLECVCLPTQLLSAHTVFADFYCRDLSSSFSPIVSHWENYGLSFDGFYSGFLGSLEQVASARSLAERFRKEGKLCFIDPAMADGGQLYHGIDPAMPETMRDLCRYAQIITPNVTEACLLTGNVYRERHDRAYICRLLKDLMELGVDTAIITGIRTDSSRMGVAAMVRDAEPVFHFTEFVPSVFHGTGDLFAATCAAALMLDYSPAAAIALAADYVFHTITVTSSDPEARWYGVNFEQTIPWLLEKLQARKEFPL